MNAASRSVPLDKHPFFLCCCCFKKKKRHDSLSKISLKSLNFFLFTSFTSGDTRPTTTWFFYLCFCFCFQVSGRWSGIQSRDAASQVLPLLLSGPWMKNLPACTLPCTALGRCHEWSSHRHRHRHRQKK